MSYFLHHSLVLQVVEISYIVYNFLVLQVVEIVYIVYQFWFFIAQDTTASTLLLPENSFIDMTGKRLKQPRGTVSNITCHSYPQPRRKQEQVVFRQLKSKTVSCLLTLMVVYIFQLFTGLQLDLVEKRLPLFIVIHILLLSSGLSSYVPSFQIDMYMYDDVMG